MRAQAAHGISSREALRTFARIGLESFGGPAGQIAVMHRVLVEERRWISESRFLHALNYCMLLPGPEAMQLVTYVGWLLYGTWGGLLAGALFVLPGFVSILVLSYTYAIWGSVGFVHGLFFGLQAAVLAAVVEAVLRIGKKALQNFALRAIALVSFLAIFVFGCPFPWIVLGAALVGAVGVRVRPELFTLASGHAPKPGSVAPAAPALPDEALPHTPPSLVRALRVLSIGLVLWFAPLALLYAWRGGDDIFVQQGLFFSQAAIVTFGGAYAVLAYLAQQAVEHYGWLSQSQMLVGLGLAETTPGPLIMVVQFVAFLGGWQAPGDLPPWLAALSCSLIAVWCTFVPCYLWIFLGAPYVESLRARPALSAALGAITAAVVGVVLNLSLWFALHVLFPGGIEERHAYGARLLVPDLAKLDPFASAIAAGALLAILWKKWKLLPVLAAAALCGMLLDLARS